MLYYIYPQELYTQLLISKQDLKFEKPDNMSEDTYKYEWLRTYTAILNQLLVELGNVCDSELCFTMTANRDWEFLCVLHSKKGMHCCPVDYCVHNLETIQNLLTNLLFHNSRSLPAVVHV
jgi:hypothetical protein